MHLASSLIHYILGFLSCFVCRLLIVFNINFFKNYFRNTIRMSNSLDLGPNCLPRLSADDMFIMLRNVADSSMQSFDIRNTVCHQLAVRLLFI